MTEYFAVIDDEGRRGPFATMEQAASFLKEASRARRHTNLQARDFFLFESSVVQVEEMDGQLEFFNLGWLAREESGRQEPV